MLTSEGASPSTTGEEPPFLQERTHPVPIEPEQSWIDQLTDFFDHRRTPLTVFMMVGFVAFGGLIYLQRPDSPDAVDPLENQSGVVADNQDGGKLDPANSPIPVVVSPDDGATTTDAALAGLSGGSSTIAGGTTPTESTDPTGTTTAPTVTTTATTEATTTTTVDTTTTIEPTTTPTSTPTTDTTITQLDNCVIQARPNTVVYAEASFQSQEIGQIRGETDVIAYVDVDGVEWYEVDNGEIQGWIEKDGTRYVEGKCP